MNAAPRKQKAQLPALLTGPLPLVAIRDQARKNLLDLIDQKRGTKALVLDQSISGPLSLLEPSLPEVLAEHGVTKLIHLDTKPLDDPAHSSAAARLADVRNVTYLVRATLENMQIIAAQIKSCIAANKSKPAQQQQEFSAFLVPRRTIACDRILEEEGILGDLSLGEFPLDLVPLEDDVLSLELDTAFHDCVVEGDSTPLFHMARAITKLQAMFGTIPRIQGKGPASVAVRDMCIRMRKESAGAGGGGGGGAASPGLGAGAGAGTGLGPGRVSPSLISRAVLIDREVDILTPMMTQTTFEGLVDEVTGVRNGAVPWVQDRAAPGAAPSSSSSSASPAPLTSGRPGGPSPSPSTLLNSTDPFYKEFRDLPYHVAVQRLQAYARDARREYAVLGSKDLSQLKTFVKGLPKLMMLDRLSDVATPVAEQIKEQLFHDRLKHEQEILEGYDTEAQVAFIEELMCRGAGLMEVLRLLVLLNECHQGLSKKHLDSLRQEVLHTYGHQHLMTLNSLERAGFIRIASTSAKASFREMRKTLKLMVAEEEEPQPQPQGAGAAPGAGGEAPSFKPSDISFLYKGYAPLSIRLVEHALSPQGWSPLAEVLTLLPGTHFDIAQTVDANGLPSERPYKAHMQQQQQQQQQEQQGGMHSSGTGLGGSVAGTASQGPGAIGATAAEASGSGGPSGAGAVGAGGDVGSGLLGSEGREVVLVVFIGGVTFSEISALRFLESRPESKHRFVVLTTRIVNGTSLLQTFVDKVAAQVGNAVGLQ